MHHAFQHRVRLLAGGSSANPSQRRQFRRRWRRLHAVVSRARAHGGGAAWCKHRIISSLASVRLWNFFDFLPNVNQNHSQE